ncbi:MAG TPA: hypothetical protein VLF19_11130, partial [Methylomirabilota bacterium]|nr:hypothetical protein [Methylomirabilota bacterium]
MRRTFATLVALPLLVVLAMPSAAPPQSSQGVDVWMNIQGAGAKKLNIAIPEFAVVAGPDTTGLAKQLA